MKTGDIVRANLTGYGYNIPNGALLVLDTDSSRLLTALIDQTGAAARSRSHPRVFISKADLEEGYIESDGTVDLGKLFYVKKDGCHRIDALTKRKLDEVLRSLTKYASAIYFDSVYKSRKSNYIPASGKVLDKNDLFSMIDASLDMWLTAGRFAEKFEKEFAKTVGSKKCALVNSGSSANLVAISSLTSYRLGNRRLRPRDEVITLAAGFPTTVAPIVQNRLVPVFADVELDTYNVDVAQLEDGITDRTKAIFIPHTLGNPFDVDKVLKLVRSHGLWLVEDACDALGSEYRGKCVGSFGDLSTFSFYPAHHITMGEGGAVVSNDPEMHRIICSFRDWGRDCWCPPGKDNTCKKRFGWKIGSLPLGYDHKYIFSHLGYNLKATDLQAAIGLSQLKKLSEFKKKRKENFDLLFDGFKKRGLNECFILPRSLPKSDANWFGFPLTIRDGERFQRRELITFLEMKGIGTRLLFAGNIVRQPAFTEDSIQYRLVSDLTNTDKTCMDSFWIGLWPGISEKQIEYVLGTFASWCSKHS